MASLQALGGAPVSFVDANGVQYSVPLSLVTFPSAAGTPVATGWLNGLSISQQTTLQPLLNSWLQTLSGQGLLAASSVPAAPPAFTITARDTGSSGNYITVAFSKVTLNASAPAQTLVDVAVTATQVYDGLAMSSIAGMLGSTPGGGTKPGLAYVSNVGTTLPVNVALENFSTTPSVQLAIAAASGTAFTLIPTHATDADAKLLKAGISNADPIKNTFSLTLNWTKSVTQVPLASLQAQFGYLINITPPPGGFAYPPAAFAPATLQVALQGGADQTAGAAVAAQAVVIAG